VKIFFLILSLLATFTSHAAQIHNTLKNHASPYLALHGTDPVAWQEWNKETVARAKKEGKLLYVSSGYFSCHWCHVMQRESYKNNQVAEILNKNFIPVKVDREINSALDSHLIDFVERTQGRAGWPLNVFITPDGYPLVGMTYVPTENFISILNNLKVRWKNEKSLLEVIAINATNELSTIQKKSTAILTGGLAIKYIKQFLSEANTMTDDMSGGFGQENKFPSVPQLNLMLSAYENKPEKELKQFLLLTLNKMATQGLYDQLGGGFFRYAVDPLWQIPHFEKMLYDNAQLAVLYMDAARIFKNEKFSQVSKDTLNFMMRTFQTSKGASIASLSALDDKGIEGGYYLWSRDELNKILNPDELKIVELIWQIEGVADIDGGHHLVEIMNVKDAALFLKFTESKVKNNFESAKKKMLAVRNNRVVPRDDKLLAAWNGLALTAFAKAAKQFDSVEYARVAKEIKNYIYDFLWIDNKLVRVVKNKKILGDAGLEDYAYVAQGLYHWLEYSDNKKDSAWLNALIKQTWARYYNEHGWRLSENSLLKYGQSQKVISDGVLPSASATIVNVALKTAEKNNDIKLMQKVEAALKVGHSDIANQPFWFASQIHTIFDYQKLH
jgi:hypothetical protein